MDTAVKTSAALLFHLSGRSDSLPPVAGLGLLPVHLARYRALHALRHDFPLVLCAGREWVQTLSGAVDRMLGDVAPRGPEGERLRRHALQLESAIRRDVAAGRRGWLSTLWDETAAAMSRDASEGDTLEQVLLHAGGGLHADGPVLGCTRDMPAQLVRHAWRSAQRAKARQLRADLARLVLKLSDILRAARAHSQDGAAPQALQASVGSPHHAQFDFTRLSRMVAKGRPADELPASRRERLQRTLRVLESQRFVSAHEEPETHDDAHDDTRSPETAVYGFEFADCAAATAAFQQRLPAAAELIRAMAVAELEARGAYVEAEHDAVFATFGPERLGQDDLARLPDSLVCIGPDEHERPQNASLMAMLSSGMPVKVLVQTDRLDDDAVIGQAPTAFGVRSGRLATAAMALGGMYVLQAAASQLFALRDRVAAGLAARGPALLCVYLADGAAEAGLPPYLATACAAESRAFASFCYDAAAGPNWATRFSLAGNPQPESDWPTYEIEYADLAQQRRREVLPFTYTDFALTDPRQAAHFAQVPPELAHDPAWMPAAEWLAAPESEVTGRVPTVWAVDTDDRLLRVAVDARVMQAARRCRLLWHRLQEHAGIHDSHAEALLAREKAAWSAQAAPSAPVDAPRATAPAASAAPEATATAEHSRDEAWIETARCPSCNECQRINDRMFAYDERKQAYIKDITAGSYRQLVEAAESCQVAIIHPGKPRDPNEPGLEELLARAEPFR